MLSADDIKVLKYQYPIPKYITNIYFDSRHDIPPRSSRATQGDSDDIVR